MVKQSRLLFPRFSLATIEWHRHPLNIPTVDLFFVEIIAVFVVQFVPRHVVVPPSLPAWQFLVIFLNFPYEAEFVPRDCDCTVPAKIQVMKAVVFYPLLVVCLVLEGRKVVSVFVWREIAEERNRLEEPLVFVALCSLMVVHLKQNPHLSDLGENEGVS